MLEVDDIKKELKKYIKTLTMKLNCNSLKIEIDYNRSQDNCNIAVKYKI